MKKLLSLLICVLLGLSVTACAEQTDPAALTKPKDINESWDETAVVVELNGASVSLSGEGAVWDATAATLTFAKAGDYVLSGALTGRLVVAVDKEEDVRLILRGVSVTSPEGPALYVQSADKVVLTLDEGTTNAFADAASMQDGEETISSCVYSKDDLTINGAGALTVTGNVKNGIVCKNDLLLVNGDVTVTALGNGVRGKDSVTLLGGSLTITSDGDGLVSDADDAEKIGHVLVTGGTLTLTTGGGAGNAAAHAQYWGWGDSGTADGSSVSMKGIKAAGEIAVEGGTIVCDSADDALHASDIAISGGTLRLASGDDGAHADNSLTISGGAVDVTQSYEGLEATAITIGGGEISVVASDDGINAAGGNDASGQMGFGGSDRFGGDSGATIVITGGTLRVNASGDGVNSNGSISMSGGEVYVSGPTNSGNGALDYNGDCTVTGGTLVAAGASGMAQNVGQSSTQAALMVSGCSGGELTLLDANGSILLTYTPEKAYDCAVISCPGLTVGGTYTVTSGGAQVYSGTLTQTVSGGGSEGFGGGFGGGGGHGGGRR